MFSAYSPCSENLTVRITYGSLSKVTGTGSVKISEELTLNLVLLVLNLDCNLLSVSKLTRELNCVANFLPNLCEFQVSDLAKMIGSARMCSEL